MNNKTRRPWLAGLLTLLFTGLGHMYSGRLKRGMVLFVIGQLLNLGLAISLTAIAPNRHFMLFVVGISVAFSLYCVIDAATIAIGKNGNFRLLKYNKWFAYLGYVAISVLLVELNSSAIVAPYFIQSFTLPTGSMEPTLLIGDHLLVNNRIYRIAEPKRGDVLVFKYPKDPRVLYVKRLIGLPGEKIEVKGRTVYINDRALDEKYAQHVIPEITRDHFGPWHIPKDNYFVMGDNRDNSQDSRYWGGIPRDYLLGKTLIVYWSFKSPGDLYLRTQRLDRLKLAIDRLVNLRTQTRWNRIFQVIE